MTDEVKIYKISGNYVKNFQKFNFSRHTRALKEEDALENVLSVITSSKILRRKVNITEIVVVPPEECTDLYMRQLAEL